MLINLWGRYNNDNNNNNNDNNLSRDKEKSLADEKIQRGIFKGDALSLLIFAIVMMLLNHILKKSTAWYKLSKLQEDITYLMYMDNIKLLAKSGKELETLIQAVRIYSQYIGMEFGIEKCAMFVMKSGKRLMMKGVELLNQAVIRTLRERETCKYLGILETDTIKVEMKEKFFKKYLRRTRKLLETKLYCRNLAKGIKTWALLLVRYSGPFLKSIRDERKQMDQRTRKLMTMHKALYPRDNVDRLHLSRKEGERGLASIEDSIDTSIKRLEDFIEKHKGRLIRAIWSNTDDMRISRTTITRKQKWEEKQIFGRFKRLTSDISHEKTWTGLRKGNIKRETESLQTAIQKTP